MVYYKALDRSYSGVLGSWSLGKYRVIYPIGEIVVPKLIGSKLFAFDSLNLALDFIKKNGVPRSSALFECEVTNPSKLDWIPLSSATYRAFWNNTGDFDSFETLTPAPGTVFVDSIKLVKEVEINWRGGQ